MAQKLLSSYEVIAQPVAPGVPDVPYVQQGFFLQISNLEAVDTTISIEYVGTPNFVQAHEAVKLFANVIDLTGNAVQYDLATFMAVKTGFKGQVIPPRSTSLFGVQYLLLPPPAPIVAAGTGATPQDSAGSRGFVRLEATAGSRLLILATIRQVFYDYDPAGALIDVAEGAYAVPLATGPEVNF